MWFHPNLLRLGTADGTEAVSVDFYARFFPSALFILRVAKHRSNEDMSFGLLLIDENVLVGFTVINLQVPINSTFSFISKTEPN